MDAQLTAFLARAEKLIERIEATLPHGLQQPDWGSSIAFKYRRRSSGQGVIAPVVHIGAMNLNDLKEINLQKERIQRNTEQFVRGLPANNVLLTGSRGTGKSSLIRDCFHA